MRAYAADVLVAREPSLLRCVLFPQQCSQRSPADPNRRPVCQLKFFDNAPRKFEPGPFGLLQTQFTLCRFVLRMVWLPPSNGPTTEPTEP
jgi:hypothetical protein